MADERAPGKGKFGRARLPVALAYVLPAGRSRIIILAAGAGLLGLIVLAANFWLQDGHLISSGPLSASHATLERNCAACHVGFQSVSSDKCSACHERALTHAGSHTFAAHYVYVSGDQTRAFSREGEVPCAACHVEHKGRDARPTTVSDEQCTKCHANAPFDSKHPQFAFAAQPASGSDALKFTHIKHVERILDETKSGDIQSACIACHKPTADGHGFEPIQFETSCAACHLGKDVTSADLKIVPATGLVRRVEGRTDLQLGVETLDMIRRRRGPGEEWALSINPLQFEQADGMVTKMGVVHKDPWITQNLRDLRHLLYPSQGLADLLVASADVDASDKRTLYDEALRTVKGYAAALQAQPQPWVQDDLAQIAPAIAQLESRIADPATPLSATKFRLDRTPDPTLTAGQVEDVNAFAAQVAQPCETCHRLEGATIVRPEADQRVLRRAVFNHRAHVIQRDCLQCHTEIPFAEYLDSGKKVPAAVDRAAIQNIPKIEVCRDCHTPTKASTACQTCHVFHPASDVRAGLARSAP